jgi:hypothetical protein
MTEMDLSLPVSETLVLIVPRNSPSHSVTLCTQSVVHAASAPSCQPCLNTT